MHILWSLEDSKVYGDFDATKAKIWPDFEWLNVYSVHLALRILVCSGVRLLC